MKRQSLKFYQEKYKGDIGHAFEKSFLTKRKLLSAIRLYDEKNFDKALKALSDLQKKCKLKCDLYTVGLFMALTLTEMGSEQQAINVYTVLINEGLVLPIICQNLGHLCQKLGNHDGAIQAYQLSIQSDSRDPIPYNNLAKLYFDTGDMQSAKKHALKALELNHKMPQPAATLALIYTLEDDQANIEKYYRIATANGYRPEALNGVIGVYRAAMIKSGKVSEPIEEEI